MSKLLKQIITYFITLLLLLLIILFLVGFETIIDDSMSPTLNKGDIVLISKYFYYSKFPQRNEIVLIKKDNKSYIKRIVGLPNEKIYYLNGLIYVNDKPYKEIFLDKNNTSDFLLEDICSKDDCPNGTIPDNKYLVMGDNRENSIDSRSSDFGLVDKDEINGKVFFRLFPFNLIDRIK